MKLSPALIEILSNFANINQSILIEKGADDVSTINTSGNIFATAVLPEDQEEFIQDFVIYDLNDFLNVVNMMSPEKDVYPEVNFDPNGKFVELVSENQVGRAMRLKYYFGAKDVIDSRKITKLPAWVGKFILTEADLNKLILAAKTMRSDTIVLTNEGAAEGEESWNI